jgi:hypothetical protein
MTERLIHPIVRLGEELLDATNYAEEAARHMYNYWLFLDHRRFYAKWTDRSAMEADSV